MAMLFFLVTISNAIKVDVATDADLKSLQTESMSMTFDAYEHPVKPVALDFALQNVKKLPEDIRAMLTSKNASAELKEVSAHDRARALKDKQEREHAFLHGKTSHGSQVEIGKFAGIDSPDPTAEDPTQYKTLDKVRTVLNDLYQQTLEEMDVERTDCYSAESTLKQQILVNTDIRVRLASTIAQARAEISQAQTNIVNAEANLIRLKDELENLQRECHETLTMAYEKKAIIDSDLATAEKIENMTDCTAMAASAASGTALFQCMVHTSDGKRRLKLAQGPGGDLMKKFKSKEAFVAMMSAAHEALGTAPDDKLVGADQLGEGNMTSDEYDEWMDLPQDGDWLGEVGVQELPKDCKALDGRINLGEKCEILYDAVGQMVGEISDAASAQNTFVDNEEHRCKTEAERLEAQIGDETTTLSNNQIALSEATEKLDDTEEKMRKRVEQFLGLRDDLVGRMTECNVNLRQIFEEMCSLITIRDELFKMSGVNVFMQDCEVGDWTAKECTKSCGGGMQQFMREITQEQYFGAACPPLMKEGMCNMDPCPINCVYENDWSGWTACSADCGGGVMQRVRSIKIQDEYQGKQCEATQGDIQCNVGACDVDCVLGHWSEWSGCSKLCDGGVQTRRKGEAEAALGNGLCSDPDETDEKAEGGGSRFEERPCNADKCVDDLTCNTRLDIVFALDGSGSVGSRGWNSEVKFTRDMVGRIELDYDLASQVGIVLFAKKVSLVHTLSADPAALETAIGAMRFPRGYTNTGGALMLAKKELEGGRTGVPGVIFIVTDGKPTWGLNMDFAANELKRAGTRLFFVGVGPSVTQGQNNKNMLRWASKPSNQNFVGMKNFAQLEEKVSSLVADLCPILECRETFVLADESDYKGCQTETVNQITCQNWDSQAPHEHEVFVPWRETWDGSLMYPTLGMNNFCRNPDGNSGGIWCFTQSDDVQWDYCDPRNVSTVPAMR